MKDAVQSTVQSQNVTSAVQNIGGKVTQSTHTDKLITEAFIRKLAHFSEFFVLGFLTYMTCYLFKMTRFSIMFVISCVIFLFVAVFDECLQLFSNGRAPLVSDVIIDFAGAIAAFLICVSVYCIKKRLKRK